MAERETWATRVGFLVAAIGSAVGLGNLWQFPFKTAGNYSLLLPLSVLLLVLFVGWVLANDAVAELRKGTGGLESLGPVWLWGLRLVVPLLVLVTLGLGVYELFLVPEPTFFAPF